MIEFYNSFGLKIQGIAATIRKNVNQLLAGYNLDKIGYDCHIEDFDMDNMLFTIRITHNDYPVKIYTGKAVNDHELDAISSFSPDFGMIIRSFNSQKQNVDYYDKINSQINNFVDRICQCISDNIRLHYCFMVYDKYVLDNYINTDKILTENEAIQLLDKFISNFKIEDIKNDEMYNTIKTIIKINCLAMYGTTLHDTNSRAEMQRKMKREYGLSVNCPNAKIDMFSALYIIVPGYYTMCTPSEAYFDDLDIRDEYVKVYNEYYTAELNGLTQNPALYDVFNSSINLEDYLRKVLPDNCYKTIFGKSRVVAAA